MGTSSTKKLTKYTSGTTIVTAEVANAWFGGLSGSYEGTLLDVDDPRVIGHVHDGESYDGHAGKINLVNHVTDKLLHQNLSDNAVWKNNVASFLDQTQAIPESITIGSDKYYYLDLRDIYTYVDDEIAALPQVFEESDTGGSAAVDVIRQKNIDYSSATGLDFLVGSSKLDDLASGTNGDNRFFFDKSKGAFRAGIVDAAQWDDANRGDYSVSFGRRNTALGAGSAGFGFQNTIAGNNSISAGSTNTVTGTNSIAVGLQNTVGSAAGSSAIFGSDNNSISPSTLIYGSSAVATTPGEFVHATGRFVVAGDAQSSEYVVRARIITAVAGTIVLSADGLGANYQMELNAAYSISVSIIGKRSGPSVEAGSYRIEAMGVGPTTTPTPSTMSAPILTFVSRTAYFTAGVPNVVVGISAAGGEIRVTVTDATLIGSWQPTSWVATVRVTKCKV